MHRLKVRSKALLRWLVLGATLFFVGKVLKDNWQQVVAIRITGTGWASLTIALVITLLAHLWAAWVWSQILHDLRQPVERGPIVRAYLKTTIAKYLPGNIWHYYGRVQAATQQGAALGAATLSVLLEPLLMAAAALLLVVGCAPAIGAGLSILALQGLGLAGILATVHPRVLNRAIGLLGSLKRPQAKTSDEGKEGPLKLTQYPIVPLLGELGFVLLRGVGFLFTVLALHPIAPAALPLLLGGFSLAWLLGLVVPGAPGGVGVFEATAIALLHTLYPAAVVVSVVALYRLISVGAEGAGAGLAWWGSRR